jgi:hypothetical protein
MAVTSVLPVFLFPMFGIIPSDTISLDYFKVREIYLLNLNVCFNNYYFVSFFLNQSRTFPCLYSGVNEYSLFMKKKIIQYSLHVKIYRSHTRNWNRDVGTTRKNSIRRLLDHGLKAKMVSQLKYTFF